MAKAGNQQLKRATTLKQAKPSAATNAPRVMNGTATVAQPKARLRFQNAAPQAARRAGIQVRAMSGLKDRLNQ